MSFPYLGLSTALYNATLQHGYTQASVIQQAVIPAILKGQDVLATAPTGSGKTAAFCLPLLQAFLKSTPTKPRQTTTLVLVPTRELAQQIGDNLQTFSQDFEHAPKLAVVFGGVSINPQMLHLRGGADIVVATPGRLLDLIDSNALQLSHVAHLVLDEADRLLEPGFADELSRILALLPSKRQNLFFSATFSPTLENLAHQLLENPLQVNIGKDTVDAPDIFQRALQVDDKQRTQLLRHLISTEKWPRVLVFVARKYTADLVASKLCRAHIDAESLHGDLSQGKRNQVLRDFKTSQTQVLVATDVAARGIDISFLPAVINYDLPRSTDDYLHRIGRTGRAGESGVAISFICSDHTNEAHFNLIEKRHKLNIPREQIEGFIPTPQETAPPPVLDQNGGIKGKRPSKKDKLRALKANEIHEVSNS